MVIAIRGGEAGEGMSVWGPSYPAWWVGFMQSSSEQCAVKKKATLLVYRQAS